MEGWFGLITQRAIRRGSFTSVGDLVEKIDAFVQRYNRSNRPFLWTASPDFVHEFPGHDTMAMASQGFNMDSLSATNWRGPLSVPYSSEPNLSTWFTSSLKSALVLR